MVQCFAADCKHNNDSQKCKFFRFPRDPKLFRKWADLSRRGDGAQPNENSRLCSCHFEDGIKDNGPSIFHRNATKALTFHSPEKRIRKRKAAAEVELESDSQGQQDDTDTPADLPTSSADTIVQLQQQLVDRENEIRELRDKLEASEHCVFSMTYHDVSDDDSLLGHYTGLPDNATFQCILNFTARFPVESPSWNVTAVTAEDQLLITLMKLRHNFTHKHLAFLFKLSVAAITNITLTWIDVLHELLYVGILKALGIPSRHKNQLSMPQSFDTFQGARITLDCTEIQCSVPRMSMSDQSATFSHYKQRNTFKALVGVAPNGAITFVSELYPGSVSDKQIVLHSKVLDQMEPGDLVLADKGFLLHDVLPQGVSVNVPPFLTTQQFSKDQVVETTRIARARIHVERAIQRLKVFRILNFVPASYRCKATKIFQVCASLANMQKPIIKAVDM